MSVREEVRRVGIALVKAAKQGYSETTNDRLFQAICLATLVLGVAAITKELAA